MCTARGASSGSSRNCSRLDTSRRASRCARRNFRPVATLEEKANRYGHSSSRQAATIAKEAEVGLLVLTHLSPRYEDPTTILDDATKVFPNTRVAEDFLEIEVPYPE